MGRTAYIYFMPVCPMVFLFKIHSLKEINLLEEKKKEVHTGSFGEGKH